MSRLGSILFALALGGCVEQVFDLRVPPQPADADVIDDGCGLRQRLNPDSGLCEPCNYVEGHPEGVCPCGYEYVQQPFPWCAAQEAYYECLPCRGDITSCKAFEATSSGYGIGESVNCARLLTCCAQLAMDADSTPCCQAGESLRCDLDRADDLTATVSCEPEGPSCCLGRLCPAGDGDCAAWQSCVDGRCDAACAPESYACCITCGCTCEIAVSPP